MEELNKKIYNAPGVLNWYDQLQELIPAERAVFEKHKAFLNTASVLDLGVGGGRTTAFLLKACNRYTGIDYSEGFVALAKRKYPHADIRLADARHLFGFPDRDFDFVNFSLNGIDYVDLADREKILAEVNRVLKPGGLFFFSTHNKSHSNFGKEPWQSSAHSFSTNVKLFLRLFPFRVYRWKQKRKDRAERDFAVITDSAHNYRLQTFYTSPSLLRTQLSAAGFEQICFLSKSGREAEEKELDDWIFVSCQKSAT